MRISSVVTTNATVTDSDAWALLTDDLVDVSVSFDGLPDVHDRHRRWASGTGTASTVLATIRGLMLAGKDVGVVTVVRPDTLDRVADGLRYVSDLGVRRVDLSLDLWTDWCDVNGSRLEQAVADAASVWRDRLGDLSVNWFDEKGAGLAGMDTAPAKRCGFGDGELTVAPPGHLYPCERLVGEDHADNPMRLAGHVLDAGNFVDLCKAPGRCGAACGGCSAASLCNTTCRCANYVRTGNMATPDRLLCLLNQACLREVAALFKPMTENAA